MSVIVTANYEGETFEVEVFHDGSIEFPGRDFRYDQAVAEFAPPGPATVQLYEMWKESPISVVCRRLELPGNSRLLLAADYAEHVLRFFEDKYPDDGRLRAVIETTRDFVAGKIDRETFGKTRRTAWEANDTVLPQHAAAWAAADAIADTAATAAEETSDIAWAAARAADAAAHNASPDLDSAEWQQGRNTEVAWQVRRFVDCMEAVGQGKDWPDLGVTK